TRHAEGAPRPRGDRQRDLLPRPVPPAAVFRRSRVQPRRVSPCRAGGGGEPRDSGLRRADRGAAAHGRVHHRAGRPRPRRSGALIRSHTSSAPPAAPTAAGRSRMPSLTTQIFLGLVLGVVVGYVWPSFAVGVKPLADIFLRMIKMIIAPLLFSTLVVG